MRCHTLYFDINLIYLRITTLTKKCPLGLIDKVENNFSDFLGVKMVVGVGAFSWNAVFIHLVLYARYTYRTGGLNTLYHSEYQYSTRFYLIQAQ